MRTIALQQSEARRIQYMAEISLFHPDMLIWIDETGSDRRNSIRKYGYSLRGTPAQVFQLRVGGKCISAIPILTTHGIEDVYTSTETINGERFEDFLCQCLLPIIMPFDGVNPRSVVVMDNASIHHLARVQDIITGVGARLVFLPPYSPDLMPLEEVFAEVKALLRANDSIYMYLASTIPRTNGQISIYHENTRKLLSLHTCRACWLHVDCVHFYKMNNFSINLAPLN